MRNLVHPTDIASDLTDLAAQFRALAIDAANLARQDDEMGRDRQAEVSFSRSAAWNEAAQYVTRVVIGIETDLAAEATVHAAADLGADPRPGSQEWADRWAAERQVSWLVTRDVGAVRAAPVAPEELLIEPADDVAACAGCAPGQCPIPCVWSRPPSGPQADPPDDVVIDYRGTTWGAERPDAAMYVSDADRAAWAHRSRADTPVDSHAYNLGELIGTLASLIITELRK